MDPNIGINVLKYEFLSKTPGLYSIQTINKLAIELQFYYTKRFNLPAGIFYYFFLINKIWNLWIFRLCVWK